MSEYKLLGLPFHGLVAFCGMVTLQDDSFKAWAQLRGKDRVVTDLVNLVQLLDSSRPIIDILDKKIREDEDIDKEDKELDEMFKRFDKKKELAKRITDLIGDLI